MYLSIEPVGATTTPPPERKGARILRRILTGVTLGVVLLALGGAGGAFAQSMVGGVIQCEVRPCIATGDNQVLFERVGDDVPDRMIAKGAHDILRADPGGYMLDLWCQNEEAHLEGVGTLHHFGVNYEEAGFIGL